MSYLFVSEFASALRLEICDTPYSMLTNYNAGSIVANVEYRKEVPMGRRAPPAVGYRVDFGVAVYGRI